MTRIAIYRCNSVSSITKWTGFQKAEKDFGFGFVLSTLEQSAVPWKETNIDLYSPKTF